MLIALLAGKDTPQAKEMLEEAKRLSGKQKSVTISFLTDMEKLKRGTGSEELLANSSKASIDRHERTTMASKVEKRGGAAVKSEAQARAMLDQADEVGKMLDENAVATAQSVKAYQTKDYVALGKWLMRSTKQCKPPAGAITKNSNDGRQGADSAHFRRRLYPHQGRQHRNPLP